MTINIIIAALVGALSPLPQEYSPEQALVAFEILKDDDLQFGQGASVSRTMPTEVARLRSTAHLETRCGPLFSTTARNLPNGYLVRLEFVSDKIRVSLERHVPQNFDEEVRALKKGQCMEVTPLDRIVFAASFVIDAETNDAKREVELGDGYKLRYISSIDSR
ncbi:hypothetical protein [Xanthomonas sp. MLO165]|uniref:hypothetical protein n=1 Tax=Xanthomonas sp. MLO165 TaxID=2081477 RepID=UPI001C043A21|nr:hypothetical protein [Xanthomonas sp. MLO165]